MTRLRFAPAEVTVERLSGGRMVLRSPMELGEVPRAVGDVLERWATAAPERLFLAEADGAGGQRRVTYGEALDAARSLGQALLDRGLGPRRPLAILSENSVDHALLGLGAMHAGVPVVPVSTAYSLVSRDHAKLRSILEIVKPGLVFASDGETYARALDAAVPEDVGVVTAGRPPPGRHAAHAESLAELRATRAGAGLEAAFAALGPDTIAKVLFTSGSTGEPKGVLNTQRMVCSNQQAIFRMWPFLSDRPPVVVDWLPWSHTFGGNHNFYMVLWHGGALHVDPGKPAPGLIERTIATLKSVSPTLYFNVPRGFDMLLPHLENDEALRATFFKELDALFYAAAALPQSLWDRLEQVAIAARGERVTMVSAWGATETSPMVTSVHFPIDRPGVIGLPAPGTEVLMVPLSTWEGRSPPFSPPAAGPPIQSSTFTGAVDSNGPVADSQSPAHGAASTKFELRVRGPNVTPGYWDRPDLTKAAFDEDGFYRIGDAGKLADPGDPSRGLVFDGRIAEDFKLMSGTWVHVGTLRTRLIAACAPVVEDAVVTGHDREIVGALLFASESGIRKLCPEAPAGAKLAELARLPAVIERVARGLAQSSPDGGSSMQVRRALFLTEPPSIDAGEITDKGYLNQRRVRERRAGEVERLHADVPDEGVIRADRERQFERGAPGAQGAPGTPTSGRKDSA